MILICRLLIAMLCLSSAGLGQGSGSTQTGYVAVTPVVGFGEGLTIQGRIEHQADGASFHGTVWSGGGVIRTALIVSSDRRSGIDTGIALVNPNDFAADITLTLRRDDGQIVATRIITLERRRQISRFIGEIFSGQGELVLTGFLSISSTLPLGIAGLLFQGQEFSFVPNTGPVGAPALLLPHFATGGGWSTNVVIANAVLAAQIVRVDFFSPNGTIIKTLGSVTVPAAGVAVVSAGN